jgi:hypothetical protein
MFPIKKKLSFHLISIINILFLSIINSNQIIFPFRTEPINIESSKYIEAITNNKICITTEIGEPPQNLTVYLTSDTSYFIIADYTINSSYYNNAKSTTYLKTSELTDFYFEYFTKAYYANETFLFQTSLDNNNNNKRKYNNIEFIQAMVFSDKNKITPGYFGLQIPKQKKFNFFNNLKNVNAISSYIWYLKYISDSEGYLAIGQYPPEYINRKEVLKRANALPCQNENQNAYLCWFLRFNDIKFGDIKVNRDRTAEITPELGFIVGTLEYKIKIEENYFGNILKDKCKQILSENNYYYECDKNTDVSSFKELVFSHQEFMYDFVLTKDDLFKVYGDKLYFLIVFDQYTYYGKNWKLGKPFIIKYNFIYDTDNKLILFYNNKELNDNSNNNNQQGSNLIYWIIIGFLVLCVIVMIVLVFIKIVIKPKKKKADELTDDFEYTKAERISDDNNNNKGNAFGV